MNTRATSRLLLFCLLLLPCGALAQAPTPTAAAGANQQLMKPQELDSLVAPIALYPDALLSQVLIASTYPLEVVQAERWLAERKDLSGDQLKAEADKQPWDDSIKSLAATSSVLTMMSTRLDWTRKLGDAVLAQQPDVMDAIQRLRSRAEANNKLKSTKEQTVTVRQEHNRRVIEIEPTEPGTVYVPYYDPGVVYGGWPHSDYPPYYFPPPSYVGAGLIATGIAFGAGYAIGRWASGRYWGGSFTWNNNIINMKRGDRVEAWQHNPLHRQGVRYNNAGVAQRFGSRSLGAGVGNRMDFRGRGGQQVLRPGPGSVGQGPSGARASALQSVGRHATGTRVGAGARASAGAVPRGRDTAFRNMGSGRATHMQSLRGRASLGDSRVASLGGAGLRGGFGGAGLRGGIGGAGFRGGFGGGRGGFGRRSDLALKHDIRLLGYLENGLGFYRFRYDGGGKVYVGVIAQEVQAIDPQAVVRGRDGYLRVDYRRVGVHFQSYDSWLASGARIPSVGRSSIDRY